MHQYFSKWNCSVIFLSASLPSFLKGIPTAHDYLFAAIVMTLITAISYLQYKNLLKTDKQKMTGIATGVTAFNSLVGGLGLIAMGAFVIFNPLEVFRNFYRVLAFASLTVGVASLSSILYGKYLVRTQQVD